MKTLVLCCSLAAAVSSALTVIWLKRRRMQKLLALTPTPSLGSAKAPPGFRKIKGYMELLDKLARADRVDLSLSPADNAAGLLQDIQDHGGLSSEHQDILQYAISVLKMDHGTVSVPQLLLWDDDQTLEEEEEDSEVVSFLRAGFTSLGSLSNMPQKSAQSTLKEVSTCVRFVIRLQKERKQSFDSDLLPYEVTADEEHEIMEHLKGFDDWGFDIFELCRITKGRPLQTLGWFLLSRHGLIQKFGLDEGTLQRWLAAIESRYHNNPYHNSTHAADVLQCVNFLLTTGNLGCMFAEIEILALLLSAIIHDVDHDGVSNDFHKASMSERAIRYNDQSVLEHHHVSTMFQLMQGNKDLDIFWNMSAPQKLEVRTIMIHAVLGTDMSMHFSNLKSFTSAAERYGASVESWHSDGCADKKSLMWAILHAADISAQARPNPLFLKWSDRCYEEFYLQGDKERELGRKISPMCDRSTTLVASSQVGFLKFIVIPIWKALGLVSTEVRDTCVETLCENLQYWQRCADETRPSSPIRLLRVNNKGGRGTPRGHFPSTPSTSSTYASKGDQWKDIVSRPESPSWGDRSGLSITSKTRFLGDQLPVDRSMSTIQTPVSGPPGRVFDASQMFEEDGTITLSPTPKLVDGKKSGWRRTSC